MVWGNYLLFIIMSSSKIHSVSPPGNMCYNKRFDYDYLSQSLAKITQKHKWYQKLKTYATKILHITTY